MNFEKSNMRRDPILKRWVVFSPDKVALIIDESSEFFEEKTLNPFLAENEDVIKKEIYRYKNSVFSENDWSVKVVPAGKPLLKIEETDDFEGVGIYDTMNRLGAHEVVIETPKPNISFDQLSAEEIRDLFFVVKTRMLDLRKDKRLKYILYMKNKGKKAGASIDHNYSELIAFPFIPPSALNEINNAQKYYNFKGRCVFCDMIKQEIKDKDRIVEENDDFIAFCPFASHFPFQIEIMPKQHDSDITTISEKSLMQFSRIYKNVLYKLRKALNSPAYNVIFHNSPFNDVASCKDISLFYHWQLKIIPRITKQTALTFGAEVFVNPTLPEDAAAFLRKQI